MNRPRNHQIDLLFVLALIGVFALCSFILAALGLSVYRDTAENSAEDFERRTALLYIAQKVRQHDNSGCVSLDSVGDADALVLTDIYAEQRFETWVFVAAGELREVTVPAGTAVSSADGQAIMALSDMSLALTGRALSINVTLPDAEQRTALLSLRSGAAEES